MSGATHSITDQATIVAAFPAASQRISGQPTLLDLLSAFRHMTKCAGIFNSRYDPLSLLYTAVPEGLWPMYSTRQYPATPADPGDQPNYNLVGTQAENSARKDDWNLRLKYFSEDQHMNRALIDRFLHLMDDVFTTTFKENQLAVNPKMRFQDCFNYFFNLYGTPNEMVDEQNRIRMSAKWMPQSGIDALIAQIEHGVVFGYFTNNPFTDKQLLNAFMLQITGAKCCGQWLKDWRARAKAG